MNNSSIGFYKAVIYDYLFSFTGAPGMDLTYLLGGVVGGDISVIRGDIGVIEGPI